MKNQYEHFMREALFLAEKGRRCVHPNPMVGAVVVKDGTIVGKGYHQRFGGPHAEVFAIKRAGALCAGSTLFVTLEPCSTTGKTPPCVDLIVRSGIKKVVVGAVDPNPRHQGRGIRKLRRHGITVVPGVCRALVAKQNETFFAFMKTGRPFVTVKLAMSLDGKIATRTGDSRWISCDASRQHVHQLRAEHDAVMVGVNTCVIDNARLTVRGITGRWKEPVKVVIDPCLRLSSQAILFQENAPENIILIASQQRCSVRKIRMFERKGVRVCMIRENKGHLRMAEILTVLAEHGVSSVFVEGGSTVVGHFFDEKLVDKVHFFYAPLIIGGTHSIAGVGGKGCDTVKGAVHFRDMKCVQMGVDQWFSGYPINTAKVKSKK